MSGLLLFVVFLASLNNSISSKIPICSCTTKDGVQGHCRTPKDCTGVDQSDTSNCALGFVCCPRGAISRNKCKEYSELVYSGNSDVSLMANGENNKEDTCAIVAVPLIVGGEKVQEREFPHQTVLGYGDPSDPKTMWECGGTLISENFVLTAAHCVLSHHRPTHARFGIINLHNDHDNEQIYPIEEIIMHPEYNRITKIHDIALVKLARNVQFTPYVRPACLDYRGVIEENRAIASGFGLIGHAGTQSPDLLKVILDILDKKVCFKTVKRNVKTGLLDSQICAGVLAGGKDTCQGDSGGPLQTIRDDPYCMYNLIGVTSYGGMCGFKYSPAIYTRVWSYIPWIEALVWPGQ